MTGFPDDDRTGGGPPGGAGPPRGGMGGRGGGSDGMDGFPPDPEEPLLRQPAGYLAAPPGAFGQIRRRAARRRRTRAALGGAAAAVALTGSLYLVGAVSPHGSGDVVSPPVSSTRTSAAAPPTTGATSVGPPRPSTPPSSADAGRSTGRPMTATPGGAKSTTTGAAASSGSANTGTPTTAARAPLCATSQLDLSQGHKGVALGTLTYTLILTNHSSTACRLTGYPGVSLLDAHATQIGRPATRRPMDHTEVVLAPGGSASDTLSTRSGIGDGPGICLPASTQVRVYPPDNRASLVVAADITECYDTLVISPLVAGKDGNWS